MDLGEVKNALEVIAIVASPVISWAVAKGRSEKSSEALADECKIYRINHAREGEEWKKNNFDERKAWRDAHDNDYSAFKADVWREIEKLRTFRHDFLPQYADDRLAMEKRFSDIMVLHVQSNGDLKNLLDMMAEQNKRFDRLEVKIDRIETREG